MVPQTKRASSEQRNRTARQLPRREHSPDRDRGHDRLPGRAGHLEEALEHPVLDVGPEEGEAVDADVLLGHLDGGGLREPVHAALGRAIQAVLLLAVSPLVTEDVVAIAPPPPARMARISCFKQARTPSRLVAMTCAKLAASVSASKPGDLRAGVVDRVVEPPEGVERGRQRAPRPPTRRRRPPARSTPSPPAPSMRSVVRRPVSASMSLTTRARAARGEVLGDDAAAALTRPGDEHHLAREVVDARPLAHAPMLTAAARAGGSRRSRFRAMVDLPPPFLLVFSWGARAHRPRGARHRRDDAVRRAGAAVDAASGWA